MMPRDRKTDASGIWGAFRLKWGWCQSLWSWPECLRCRQRPARHGRQFRPRLVADVQTSAVCKGGCAVLRRDQACFGSVFDDPGQSVQATRSRVTRSVQPEAAVLAAGQIPADGGFPIHRAVGTQKGQKGAIDRDAANLSIVFTNTARIIGDVLFTYAQVPRSITGMKSAPPIRSHVLARSVVRRTCWGCIMPL